MQSFTNKDKNKNKKMFFLILGWLGFFFFFFFFCGVEVRAFTVVVLKILVFSNSKNYFIYFTTSFYNTPNFLAPQKITLSILPPHFTIHLISNDSNVIFFFFYTSFKII